MSKTGRPKVDTEALTVRLPRDMLVALDDFRRLQPDLPSRPEVVRHVLSQWIAEREALPESGQSK